MQDGIERPLHMHIVGNVILDELKSLKADKVFDVGRGAGDKVVHTDNIPAFGNESVAQMRAKKSSAAGNEYSLHAQRYGLRVGLALDDMHTNCGAATVEHVNKVGSRW